MSKRALSWGLALSVALNLLVIGAVVGALLTNDRGRDRRSDRGIGGPPEIRALARGLDEDSRRALVAALRGDPVLRDGRQRLRASRAAIADALTAEPFDAAAFEAALAARRATQDALSARGAAALARRLSTLTPEARASLATRLLERR